MNKITLGMAGLVGAAIGVFVMGLSAIAVNYYSPPDVNRAEVFQREHKPPVMRIYRGGKDRIMVAKSEEGKNYITREKYLGGIKDEADRKIEEAKIEKLVGWDR